MTRTWWRDLWRSPMAAEYLRADFHGLFRLTVIVDMFWYAPSIELNAHISSQEQKYGLNPLDRRRLDWIVERAEGATQRKARRPSGGEDPREVLRAIK